MKRYTKTHSWRGKDFLGIWTVGRSKRMIAPRFWQRVCKPATADIHRASDRSFRATAFFPWQGLMRQHLKHQHQHHQNQPRAAAALGTVRESTRTSCSPSPISTLEQMVLFRAFQRWSMNPLECYIETFSFLDVNCHCYHARTDLNTFMRQV